MLPTDYVARACVNDTKGCSLKNKCEVCKKEMAELDEIDNHFTEYFKELKKALLSATK